MLKRFLTTQTIEKKPLSNHARRAGWTGSNILFSEIPEAGKIFYVKDSMVISKKYVLAQFQQTKFIDEIKHSSEKHWVFDVMKCVDVLDRSEFALSDIYQLEADLQKVHPNNHNIKAKICQQLQMLRDKNYLEFLGDGKYGKRDF